MTDYNEDISELLNYTKALYKEVRRLNMKIRNDKIIRILDKIPSKTILYDSTAYKKINDINKQPDSDKIIIKFNE